MSKHHDEGELHFEQIQHSGVQYEDRDLGARAIIVFLIVLGVSGLVLCLMVWGYFDYHSRRLNAIPEVNGPQVVNTPSGEGHLPEERFPKPALQTDDVREMNQLRSDNNAQLNSYGYVDQKSGTVHIPIDQAIDTVAKQGLPTRTAPASQGVADFGSGRDTVAGAGGGVRPETRQ